MSDRQKISRELTIGQMAKRTGINVSALRYYEQEGLIRAERSAGGQRRFQRAEIRRISFILAAQKFGFTLTRIKELLANLPDNRTPNEEDWQKIAQAFRSELNARIATLEKLRDDLDGCIGCGCLSLKRCKIYNQDDHIGERGSGAQLL